MHRLTLVAIALCAAFAAACHGDDAKPSDGGTNNPCDGGACNPSDGGTSNPCDGGACNLCDGGACETSCTRIESDCKETDSRVGAYLDSNAIATCRSTADAKDDKACDPQEAACKTECGDAEIVPKSEALEGCWLSEAGEEVCFGNKYARDYVRDMIKDHAHIYVWRDDPSVQAPTYAGEYFANSDTPLIFDEMKSGSHSTCMHALFFKDWLLTGDPKEIGMGETCTNALSGQTPLATKKWTKEAEP